MKGHRCHMYVCPVTTSSAPLFSHEDEPSARRSVVAWPMYPSEISVHHSVYYTHKHPESPALRNAQQVKRDTGMWGLITRHELWLTLFSLSFLFILPQKHDKTKKQTRRRVVICNRYNNIENIRYPKFSNQPLITPKSGQFLFGTLLTYVPQ